MKKIHVAAMIVVERMLNDELPFTIEDYRNNPNATLEYLCAETIRMSKQFL